MDHQAGAVVIGLEQLGSDTAPAEGYHNSRFEESRERLIRGATYKDCSTVCVMPTPTSGDVYYKVQDAFTNMMRPMNQRFCPLRIVGDEVGDAFTRGIKQVLEDPVLSKWKFVLTFEWDNLPPPDGLLLLIESIYNTHFAAVGGLYWTKGETGQPMIYGDPHSSEPSYQPQVPLIDSVQECRGIAMGFTLWDMDLFRDERLWVKEEKLFRTVQGYDHRSRMWEAGTQDLEFCKRAAALGYRFAVDTRCRVGHVQLEDTPTHAKGFVW